MTNEPRPSLFWIGGLVVAGLLVLVAMLIGLLPVAVCARCDGVGVHFYSVGDTDVTVTLVCAECDRKGRTPLLVFWRSPHKKGHSPFRPARERYEGDVQRWGR